MTFSSYAGNGGVFVYAWDDPKLGTTQGLFSHCGGQIAGKPSNSPPVRIAQITDGTSNTLMYGEHAHSKMVAAGTIVNGSANYDVFQVNWWSSGDLGDTTFSSIFPPNYFSNEAQDILSANRQPDIVPRQGNFDDTCTSMHPGGANFAFADGSVRFLKNSVNSWNPKLITASGPGNNWVYNTGGQTFGVYQALSTRNGGEVISSDQY
jgi:prepilin-type processing-associated H-X9-DG protein